MHSNGTETNGAAAGSPSTNDAGQVPATGKRAWRTPAMEEVPITDTAGAGAFANNFADFPTYGS
jgi:hypothetical protein